MAHPVPSAAIRRRPRTPADLAFRSEAVRRRLGQPHSQAENASSILVARSHLTSPAFPLNGHNRDMSIAKALMLRALEVAADGLQAGEMPIGAVVAVGD